MKRAIIAVMIAAAFPTAAFATDRNIAGFTTYVWDQTANSNFASLQALKGSVTLAAGDRWFIIDATTSTGIVPTGGLLIDVGSNGAVPLTIDGGGKILRHAASTGSGAIKIAKSTALSGILLKNMYLENSGTTGMALYVDASSNVTGLTVQNVTISDSPTVAEGANQNAIRIDTYTSGYCYAWFDNVTLELPDQLDIVAYGDGSNVSTNSGIVYLTNCKIGGATGGTGSRNCVSQDSRCEMFIYGGRYHDSAGPAIDQNAGTATTRGRIHVYGAEVYNTGTGTGSPVGNGIHAQTVVGCYIHDCPSGILLEPGSTELEESFASAFPRGVSFAYGNYLKGQPVNWGKGYCAAIECYSTSKAQFFIENNAIVDWNATTNTTTGDMKGIFFSGGASYSSVVVRNNLFKNVYAGGKLDSAAGGMFTVENNTFICGGNNLDQNSTYPASLGLFLRSYDATAKVNILFRNNVMQYVTDGVSYNRNMLWASNATWDARNGYNYCYGENVSATTNGWTPATNDYITTTAADKVTFLANGMPAPGSAAARWGKEFPTLGVRDYKPWHWVSQSACTNTTSVTPTQYVIETDLATNGANTNRFVGCSLLCVDANTTNGGFFVPIASDANTGTNNTRFTVAAPFPIVPAIGSRFVVIPGIDGGCGDFLRWRHEILRPTPVIGGFSNFDGLNRVSIPLYVRGQTGTVDVLIARPTGWTGFPPSPQSGRPSEQRPSRKPPAIINGETKLQKKFK